MSFGKIISRLCYIDTDIFLTHIQTEDFLKDIASDVENWPDKYNYEVKRLLSKGKNKKSDWTNERWIGWKDYDRICMD